MADDGAEAQLDLASALADFAHVLADGAGVEDVLQRLGDYCTPLLPADGIGVLLVHDKGLFVGSVNSELGAVAEKLEVETADGPCTHAIRTGGQVLVPDLEAAVDRFPRFAPLAIDAGVRGVHAFPMFARGHVAGALNVVSGRPAALDRRQAETIQVLANVALQYLTTSRYIDEMTAEAARLRRALDSRIVIEQAKGRLAERYGEPIDAAFQRLRSHARTNRTSVREVAERYLEGELDL